MAKMNKARFVTGNDISGIRVDVGLEFHKTIDYDRKAMRRALTQGAGDVRKEARRLVARRAIASQPGEAPARQTGRLMRSIGVVTRGSKGGWIKIGPKTFKGADAGFFYPAVLFYGSTKMNIAKRANYMEIALKNKRETVRSQIRATLQDALVPR